jgi:hypothetical protein
VRHGYADVNQCFVVCPAQRDHGGAPAHDVPDNHQQQQNESGRQVPEPVVTAMVGAVRITHTFGLPSSGATSNAIDDNQWKEKSSDHDAIRFLQRCPDLT